MNQIRNILVPVDFSSSSVSILKQGARLASWNGATLRSHVLDLVVIGTTGQTNWSGLRLGSNAEHLVHNSHCSVLAIKAVAQR